MSAPADTAYCALCDWHGPVELVMGHIRGADDIDAEPATWPAGSLVIVDETLEPDDFALPAPPPGTAT